MTAVVRATLMLLMLLTLFVLVPAYAEPVSGSDIKVVDGDTIDYNGQRYRMIGYDTPKTSNVPWREVTADERALGTISKDRLAELLQTGAIDQEERPCSCSRKAEAAGTCNHRRKCAVLMRDGKNVGETLIAEELAVPFNCTKRKCQKMPDWPAIIRAQMGE